jgi:hypothetical protein
MSLNYCENTFGYAKRKEYFKYSDECIKMSQILLENDVPFQYTTKIMNKTLHEFFKQHRNNKLQLIMTNISLAFMPIELISLIISYQCGACCDY